MFGNYRNAQYPLGFIPAASRPLKLHFNSLNLAAGITDQVMNYRQVDGAFTATGVPPGEVWFLTFGLIYTLGTVPATSEIMLVIDPGNGGTGIANYYVIAGKKAPVTQEWYPFTFGIMVEPGDSVRAYVSASTAGNDLKTYVYGHVQQLVLNH